MSKGATVKDALKALEDKLVAAQQQSNPGQAPAGSLVQDQVHIKLMMSQPLITKLDASLATLSKCEHLSLSTNMIEKISNLQGLANLRKLSLSRNSIKKIEALDAVSDTLEEFWISYNQIEKLNGIEVCKKLKVVYASNNKIKAWDGVNCLKDLPALEDLLLSGNPLEEKHTAEGNWRDTCSKTFPQIKRLDGQIIIN